MNTILAFRDRFAGTLTDIIAGLSMIVFVVVASAYLEAFL